jgi:hypothetical protein
MAFTASFEENGNGWSQFHSWLPEQIIGLNNKLFTFKNGQLYRHYDENAPRANYYGQQYTSKIKTVFNQAMEDDKIFKNLVIESTKPLDVVVNTNYSSGTIAKEEFIKKGSRYFAYFRKNEDDTEQFGGRTQGVGAIQSSSGTTITFSGIPNNVNIGDGLYLINGGNQQLIGVISNVTSTTISVSSVTNAPVNSNFCFAKKPNRIEGGEIRGYYLEVELEYDGTDPVEVYAVSSNAVKSHV